METETLPEVAAQFLFVMLLTAVMFGISLVFKPKSRRRRERAAARGG